MSVSYINKCCNITIVILIHGRVESWYYGLGVWWGEPVGRSISSCSSASGRRSINDVRKY